MVRQITNILLCGSGVGHSIYSGFNYQIASGLVPVSVNLKRSLVPCADVGSDK